MNAIQLKHVTKAYKLYHHPGDRLKEVLHPGRKKYHQDFFALRDISLADDTLLVALKAGANEVQDVPTALTQRDRTYDMALSLKHWLREHGMAPTKVNLITSGPHARRSRLMFEKALGRDCPVGVLAVPAIDYDERHWWRSSQGVRIIISEVIVYTYARLLFYPPEE